MIEHFPNFFRGVVSTIGNVLLMITLLQPKYSKKITLFTMLGILVADLGTSIYCYLNGNLTMLAKIEIVMFSMLCFVVRPMFKDTFMQWLFSYITIFNINYTVLILSFIGSRKLPYPAYANSILRIILYGAFLIILWRYIRHLYRQAVEHWEAYLAVGLAIFIAFTYYFMFSKDIVTTLMEQAVPMLLIILIELAAYGSIFFSLENLQREFQVREEYQKIQAEREYLQLAAVSMSQRLKHMEEVSAQNNRAAHDRRHFNNVLLELIDQDKSGEAYALLQKCNQTIYKVGKVYCENHIVNAAISHYASLLQQHSISAEFTLDIPDNLNVDALEFSMVVSNLMENAIQACLKLTDGAKLYLYFTCQSVGRLLLELENPCTEDTVLDENGYPVAHEEGHGIGSKSVIAFTKKYDGELQYKIENGVFRVRLLV